MFSRYLSSQSILLFKGKGVWGSRYMYFIYWMMYSISSLHAPRCSHRRHRTPVICGETENTRKFLQFYYRSIKSPCGMLAVYNYAIIIMISPKQPTTCPLHTDAWAHTPVRVVRRQLKTGSGPGILTWVGG